MARRSPFTDWVFDAWDQLVLSNGDKLSFEERRRRWRELYERTYIDGKWVVNVDDAALVASLGENLAMMSGEYELARNLLREFFGHPNLTRADLIRRYESLFIREAIADILCGNVESRSDRLRAELHAPNRKKVFLNIVRNDLVNLVNLAGLENEADPRIAALCGDVVGCYAGLKRLSQAVPSFRTYEELKAALEETFGR